MKKCALLLSELISDTEPLDTQHSRQLTSPAKFLTQAFAALLSRLYWSLEHGKTAHNFKFTSSQVKKDANNL